jgi:photosystem II stability/assembly factor-like uncharacterized protein
MFDFNFIKRCQILKDNTMKLSFVLHIVIIFFTSFFCFAQENIYYNKVNNGLKKITLDHPKLIKEKERNINKVGNTLPNYLNSNDDKWQPTNGPYGGSISSIVQDTAGNIYVGTEEAGIFKSSDLGKTWKPSSNGFYFTDYPAVSICVNTKNNFIYAGLINDYIYRSTDSGEHWYKVSNSPYSAEAITITPNGSIYAATDWDGVFYSSDNGTTWWQVAYGIIKMDSTNNYYEHLCSIFAESDYTIYVGAHFNCNIYKTTNGIDWSLINNGLAGVQVTSFVKDKNGNIYTSIYADGVYYSSDKGKSWKQILYHKSISSLCITSNDILLAGGNGGIYITKDFGNTWQSIQLDNNALRNNLDDKKLLVLNNGDIIAGSEYAGIYLSTDNGANWSQSNNGIQSSYTQRLFVNDNVIYAGTLSGLYKTTDDGSTWYESDNGIQNPQIYTFCKNKDGDIFIGTNEGGIYKSSNDGASWVKIATAPNDYGVSVIGDISVNSKGYIYIINDRSGYLYFQGGQLLRTTDEGKTWENLLSNVPNYWSTRILIDSLNNIYLGNHNNEILESSDYGNTWQVYKLGTDTTVDGISCIVMDNQGKLYAGLNKWEHFSEIYASTKYGSDWNKSFTIDLSQLDVTLNGVAFSDNNLYASLGFLSTDLSLFNNKGNPGVLYTSMTNNSNQWIQPSGTPEWTPSDIVFSNKDIGFLGTLGNGVYSNHKSSTNVNNNSKGNQKIINYQLAQNYPNPFNPTTTINYSIPKPSFVTIKVYDILGREIKTLLNEEKHSGNYKVDFDGNKFTSGIYFYRIRAGDFMETKKLILLK